MSKWPSTSGFLAVLDHSEEEELAQVDDQNLFTQIIWRRCFQDDDTMAPKGSSKWKLQMELERSSDSLAQYR